MSAPATPPAMPRLMAAMEATWPPAAVHRAGPWLVREGQGGGKRVSAASAEAPGAIEALAGMEAAQAALGQTPLAVIRPGDEALDAALAERGWRVVDPVALYLAPAATIAAPVPPVSAIATSFPPLAIAREIWAEDGVGPERVAVMARAREPRTTILSRRGDRAAGVAYVACDGDIAMLHALYVSPAYRRQKSAVYMLQEAANWAQDNGADWLALAVTEANAGARALYASLGMTIVGHYHYRVK